jgi:hypothetical protein
MTYAPDQRSLALRLEYSIADAVQQRGLLAVLLAALRAYWGRPRLPPDLPAYLRADLGLGPDTEPAHWLDVPINPHSGTSPPSPPL